jgi:hypothetical protein
VYTSNIQSYEEDYQAALDGFSMASQLDPTWTEPGEHEKHLITYLTNLTELSESKVGQILCLMIAYARSIYMYIVF